jgi:hypothetical protein
MRIQAMLGVGVMAMFSGDNAGTFAFSAFFLNIFSRTLLVHCLDFCLGQLPEIICWRGWHWRLARPGGTRFTWYLI